MTITAALKIVSRGLFVRGSADNVSELLGPTVEGLMKTQVVIVEDELHRSLEQELAAGYALGFLSRSKVLDSANDQKNDSRDDEGRTRKDPNTISSELS